MRDSMGLDVRMTIKGPEIKGGKGSFVVVTEIVEKHAGKGRGGDGEYRGGRIVGGERGRGDVEPTLSIGRA